MTIAHDLHRRQSQYKVSTPDGTVLTVYVQNLGDDEAPRQGEAVTLTWNPEYTFPVAPRKTISPWRRTTNDERVTGTAGLRRGSGARAHLAPDVRRRDMIKLRRHLRRYP